MYICFKIFISICDLVKPHYIFKKLKMRLLNGKVAEWQTRGPQQMFTHPQTTGSNPVFSTNFFDD